LAWQPTPRGKAAELQLDQSGRSKHFPLEVAPGLPKRFQRIGPWPIESNRRFRYCLSASESAVSLRIVSRDSVWFEQKPRALTKWPGTAWREIRPRVKTCDCVCLPSCLLRISDRLTRPSSAGFFTRIGPGQSSYAKRKLCLSGKHGSFRPKKTHKRGARGAKVWSRISVLRLVVSA